MSARQVLAVVGAHGGKEASKTFWRRLVWRDLAYWQLHHWPEMASKPIRAFYEGQVASGPAGGTPPQPPLHPAF